MICFYFCFIVSVFLQYFLSHNSEIFNVGFVMKILQVDLKLKICRGTSIRKILVREAKSYSATKFIVGTARNHHTIRSTTSVAKYCAKKLSKDCSVLAVNNGKVVFQKEGSPLTVGESKGFDMFFTFIIF